MSDFDFGVGDVVTNVLVHAELNPDEPISRRMLDVEFLCCESRKTIPRRLLLRRMRDGTTMYPGCATHERHLARLRSPKTGITQGAVFSRASSGYEARFNSQLNSRWRESFLRPLPVDWPPTSFGMEAHRKRV